MTRLVVLGDLNLDVHAASPSRVEDGEEARTPVWTSAGGSAGTFARTAARLGAQVSFIGCVGRDLIGDVLIRSLERSGVRPIVGRSDLPTGVILALDQGDERGMICSRGANDGMDPESVTDQWFEGADHFHLSGYAILSDAQRPAAQRALRLAHRAGLSISLDPPPSNLLRAFGVHAFLEAILGVEWLFPNLEEGRVLTGHDDPDAVVDALAQPFACGALTLGENGVQSWHATKRNACRPADIVNVEPTGAGDAFAAGFTLALLGNQSLAAANRAGCSAAHAHLLTMKEQRGLESFGAQGVP